MYLQILAKLDAHNEKSIIGFQLMHNGKRADLARSAYMNAFFNTEHSYVTHFQLMRYTVCNHDFI